MRVVVIGAGVGGLTSAAFLARAGLDVTVLEAHIYPGGCAGTFYYQGFRFDAGATLAGGFSVGGPMDIVARQVGIAQWPARPANPAMVVHLPDGSAIPRWTDETRWLQHRDSFGKAADRFWQWQERTADAMWALALRLPPWPPQTAGEMMTLLGKGLLWLGQDSHTHAIPQLLTDATRPVASHLRDMPYRLRLFIDAQLLISAQTTSRYANALYGASALDLPRRGVVHLEGGMGVIAEELAAAVRRHKGQVHYRQEATRIVLERGKPVAVETRQGESFPADIVIVNLPPWNIRSLLGKGAPAHLRRLPPHPHEGWGAFTVYAGVEDSVIPDDLPLHHQMVVNEPLAESNTVFLSLSPAWDRKRAPEGYRALTLSTHTDLPLWWELFESDRAAYEARRTVYTQRVLAAAERALPGLSQATTLILPGTPVTFQRFTRRHRGWVGGFPQTSLFKARQPRLAPGLWMVGDSIFPGQSTAAVALGGLRVAQAVLQETLHERLNLMTDKDATRSIPSGHAG